VLPTHQRVILDYTVSQHRGLPPSVIATVVRTSNLTRYSETSVRFYQTDYIVSHFRKLDFFVKTNLLQIWDRARENIKENARVSAKQSLALYELEQHKP